MQLQAQLRREEFRFILLRANDKIPIEKNWTTTANYKYSDEKVIHYQGNIGVATGYGDLLVLDFDNQDVANDVIPKLPMTMRVTTGSGKPHLYYLCENGETMKILDERKDTLVDIQFSGRQIVAPGSTHPNGNKYVSDDTQIAKIDFSEIKAVFWKWMQQEQKSSSPRKDITTEIKKRISLPHLLATYGVDTSKNPTKCPLHNSRGGKCLSFNEEVCNCFHCGEFKGDIFSITEVMEHCDFTEAKNKLAVMAGVDIPKEKKSSIKSIAPVNSVKDTVQDFFDNTQRFFYDHSCLFWFWSGNKWEMVDETDLMVAIDKTIGNSMNTMGKMRSEYLEAFKRIGRINIPKIPPVEWIQFNRMVFDMKTKKIFEATPDYFFTNPVPFDIGETEDTPVIDKLFVEWVGEKHKISLYELIAYCCYRDYPIHIIFSLFGSGRNGKSQFQRLLCKFLGSDNICTTELDLLLDNRFETFKLYKKLACQMGETNFGIINKTSMLKKLSGQDMIGYEAKGKKGFDDYNYAKVIINSNSLPTSEDTSEGFYRRWFIIDFPNTFSEGRDIITTIPDVEYTNLAKKVSRILPELIERGKFFCQGTISERRTRYIKSSNPISLFVEDRCIKDLKEAVEYSKIYVKYLEYLKQINRRTVSKREFSRVIEEEGFEINKKNILDDDGIKTTRNFVLGLRMKTESEEKNTDNTDNTVSSLGFFHEGFRVRT